MAPLCLFPAARVKLPSYVGPPKPRFAPACAPGERKGAVIHSCQCS